MAALGGPLPGLLLRCSDWVASVSRQAQAAVNDMRMHVDSADAFRSWLPLLNPNGLAVRHGAFFAQTYAGVIGGCAFGDLIAYLRSPDPEVRQATARVLSNRGEAIAALDVALGDCDPLVSRIIIAGLRQDDLASATVVQRLGTSKSAAARTRAFLHLRGENLTGAADDLALTFLRERSSVIRFLGQRHLADSGRDLAKLYRSMLDNEPEPALVGLGEVGTVDDSNLVSLYVNGGGPRIRSSAVGALAKLLGLASTSTLLVALGDPSPRVARTASYALVRLGVSTEVAEASWKVATSNPLARSAAVRVLGNSGRWVQLMMALRAVAADDEDLRARGLTLFDACMWSWNRSATTPPVGVLDEIQRLLIGMESDLGKRRHELAVFSVRPYLPRH